MVTAVQIEPLLDEVTPEEVDDYVNHFRARVMQEAWKEATATYWRRRAQTFRDARPRPDDFVGNSSVEQRRERWRRLTEIAKACDARAEVALICDEVVM